MRRPALVTLLVTVLSACATGQEAPPGSPSGSSRMEPEAFMLATKQCVEEKGFEVEVDLSEYSWSFDYEDLERRRQAQDALDACFKAIDPRFFEPLDLTSDQLREMYVYAVAQNECMRAAGYPVGTPPPEQVFIDSAARWDPYVDMLDRGVTFTPGDVPRCQDVPEKPSFFP